MSAENKKFHPIVWAYHVKMTDANNLKEAAQLERQKLQGEVSRLQRDIAELTKIIENHKDHERFV